MDERIRKHQKARAGASWKTLEEERDLAAIYDHIAEIDICLIDCLTLWVNNLLYHEQCSGNDLSEEKMTRYCKTFISKIQEYTGTTICVTNEVGMGIVPENPAARKYRDLVGRCNRIIAASADQVVLVTCGIPLVLKSKK
jgi:adenosylcobinamide kinase/adenosylcobinamide-phosphate guanylyltransferase